MAHIVILGAGIGGLPMAYEMRDLARPVDRIAVVSDSPCNVNWFSEGRWVDLSKLAFEKCFLRMMRAGTSEPAFEKMVLKALGIMKLKS